MKILTANQLKEADSVSLKKQEISSLELMERAAGKAFDEIHSRLEGAPIPVRIFCGIGNNGGDGLVIGRLLIERGYNVSVYIVNYSDHRSSEFLANYERLKQSTRDWPHLIKKEEDFPRINEGDFVIDAIFGIGLDRPLLPMVSKLVKHINSSGAFILAIDLPTGLMAENPPYDKEAVIKAGYTLTFQAPKLSFFLPETAGFVGHFQILDIGLDQEHLKQTKEIAQLITQAEAKLLYRPRSKFSHKGTYGHALMVGGSRGKIGSICLSATAALKAGAGMVTVYTPACGYQIIQTALPEAMVLTDPSEDYIQKIDYDFDPDVIGFGVGVGTRPETIEAFRQLLQKVDRPMVIDADGLNILSKQKELLRLVPEGSILTPHPKELERLIGTWKNDFDKIEKLRDLVREHKVILVLKGAYSITITPGELYINSSGNPGMATAGSGDVLTGIITAFLGQKYDPVSAAILGVYLHGSAGDLAAAKLGYEGLIAGDIAKNVGPAILEMFREKEEKKN